MRIMATGSYVEGHSLLHKMDAFVKLLCILLFLVAVIFCNTIVGYVLVVGLIVLAILLSGIGFGNALGGVRHMWLFFVVIFLLNAVFLESAQPLWRWWIFQFSIEGVAQGVSVVLRVALAMILGNLLLTTTSPMEIVGAMESMFFPLKFIGVPIQDVAMILGVAMQFIPTFAEETDMIRKAQTARGARFESRRWTEKARSFLPLVVPIFLSAFRRADELSVAMEARGYHRTKKKVSWRKRRIGAGDVCSLLIACLLCVVEIVL